VSICLITYEEIGHNHKYSPRGLRLLSPALTTLKDFPYTAAEQRQEAEARASKLSIQGVQPKLSAALNVKNTVFDIVDRGGRYILKPQVERYTHLPENEDLTMRLAAIAGIEVPLHGLLASKDGSLTYFIRRFDRKGQKDKLHVEDFAQLSGASRDTKYNSSMERVADVISQYCTFPAIEKVKLFKRTLFSFLVGNEDMHLKNFSIIVRDDKVELAPGYDLVNSTLVLTAPKEELALPLHGKKRNITRKDLIQYFAIERLGISERACMAIVDECKACVPKWESLIHRSFLPEKDQKRYLDIVQERSARINLA
jgi:serine/threonine-protein kinase HipA